MWSASVCSIDHDGGMVLSLESDDAGSSSLCVVNHEGGMVLSDVSDDERSSWATGDGMVLGS